MSDGPVQDEGFGAPLAGLSELVAAYAAHPEVRAVALGGSRALGAADERSDIDLYVYAEPALPVAARAALAARRGTQAEIDNRFWEPGDEWHDTALGVHVDVMHRDPAWITGELDAVLDRHEARLGYTTCLWHNVLTSRVLFDREGWFAALQARARQPYPEALARGIVGKNRPVLRELSGSYRVQVLRAAERGDAVSVNHRVAAFLASWFDVLFALNRTPHPGEKRLLAALEGLPHVPPSAAETIRALLREAGTATPAELAGRLDALCDGLDEEVRRRL